MSRAAAVVLAATLGLSACHVTLNFGAADASLSCTTDKDCPLTSLHCAPFTGQCLACASDADCASTAGRPHCDSVLNTCVQCAGNQDCPSGSKCILTTRTCVRTCAAAADCPTGSWCDDTVCAQCDDSFHCSGSRPYCDPASYQCAACVTDVQCTTAAAPRCNRTTGQCVGCLTSGDCLNGTVCDPTDSTCKSGNP